LFDEMKDRQKKGSNFSEQDVKEIMFQAISAIAFLHKSGLMHRDIKPENFLVTGNHGDELSNSAF
jgi:serine/threonine protein kinase